MTVLVTGGAGYIGSHTCVELLAAGEEVVVFDNFSNSHPETLRRVEQITGRTLAAVEGDIRDQAALETTMRRYGCRSVIHFAGLKAVSESTEKPLARAIALERHALPENLQKIRSRSIGYAAIL